MKEKMGRLLTLAIAFAGIMILGAASTGIVAAVTTYTVSFAEQGLVSGTSWSITFNGVLKTASTQVISFTGITAANSLFWQVTTPVAGPTGVQYVSAQYYGYVNVPSQLKQVVLFQKQASVTFGFTPVSSGSVSPSGTAWYNIGSQIPISAGHAPGYFFTVWQAHPKANITFVDNKSASTMATINGPTTVTASFGPGQYKAMFTEVGLPSGTLWSVTFNGIAHGSVTGSMLLPATTIGSYAWSVPAVPIGSGVQYVSTVTSGNMYLPYQSLQALSFVKQYSITYNIAPSSSGFTTPSATTFYNAGSTVAIQAGAYSPKIFHNWGNGGTAGIVLANSTAVSTFATIGATGAITANFVTGTACSTTCSVTYREMGLPSGTFWGVTANSVFYGSHTATVTLSGYTSSNAVSWSVNNPVGTTTAGVGYWAAPATGYTQFGYNEQIQAIVFTPVYWVNIVSSPTYSGTVAPASGWVNGGSTIPIWTANADAWSFKSWASNTSSIVLASGAAASTTMKVNGPGTVTASFAQPLKRVQFVAYNLPAGTTWGVSYNGANYFTNSASLNVSGVPVAGYAWYLFSPVSGGTGVQYAGYSTSGYFSLVNQVVQAIVFQKWVLVTLMATGGTSPVVSPTGAQWFMVGTIVAINALNQTSATFTSGTGWVSAPATNTFGGNGLPASWGPHSADTTLTVHVPSTVTAQFH